MFSDLRVKVNSILNAMTKPIIQWHTVWESLCVWGDKNEGMGKKNWLMECGGSWEKGMNN